MLIDITVGVGGGGLRWLAIKMDVFNVICMQCTLQKECVGVNADCHSCLGGILGALFNVINQKLTLFRNK